MEDNHQKAAKTDSKGTALAWNHNGVHHPLGTPWECEWTICLMLLKDKHPHPWDKQPLGRAQRQARVVRARSVPGTRVSHQAQEIFNRLD